MSRPVLFAGGGTGGHVFPALATARALRHLDADLEPVFVGVADRLEAQLVPAAGFRLHTISTPMIPRKLSPRLFGVPRALRRSVARVTEIIGEEQPVAALTFGGYVSYPVARSASRNGVPLAIHEQNAVPGLANRVAARWADQVAVTVPGSALRFKRPERCVVTGNPVRDEIAGLDRAARREAARESFDLQPDRPTLLVFGGSQGARTLNQAIIEAHHLWGDLDLQVLHATGRAAHESTATAWAKARESDRGPRVKVVDFIESMADAYAAADLVVCRAGATSIAELTTLGIPSVLVPYPHATGDHQTENALALARAGGTRVIEDGALSGRTLVDVCRPLLEDADELAVVAEASRAFGRPDAAANVARLIARLASEKVAR